MFLKLKGLSFIPGKFWAGKIDKPNKDMLNFLKKKKARDFVPNLIKPDGFSLQTKRDNLNYVNDFHANIFSKDVSRIEEITTARAKIAMVRKKTISDFWAKELEKPINENEIKDNINHLANGKTPGVHGLPNEFYKEYQDFLTPYLLLVWKDSLSFKDLPSVVNTGVIKHIHKRRENKLDTGGPLPV